MSDTPTQAYPLQWPAGWRRTDAHRRTDAKFRNGGSGLTEAGWTRPATRVTLSAGIGRVQQQLRAFGVPQHNVVISSDLRLRTDGWPYASQATGRLDPGIAVYWRDGKRQRCIAIDRYTRIEDNLAAIAATLDAMRAIERHGGAEILDRAFTGFAALPAPEQWFQVLGVSATASRADIEAAHRRLAMQHHPDRGGDADLMARINTARDDGTMAAEISGSTNLICGGNDMTQYKQLPDGRWQKQLAPEEAIPQHIKVWYMRDNHTFLPLPLDVEAAIGLMRNERDVGFTCGMLCGLPTGVVPIPVDARGQNRWGDFEKEARVWLTEAVAKSKPP